MSTHTKAQQHSSKRRRPVTAGRPTKFGSPVRQKSVHLQEHQVEWVRRFAELRSQQEGVSISDSDVIRLAVEAFMTAHSEEVAITAAS